MDPNTTETEPRSDLDVMSEQLARMEAEQAAEEAAETSNSKLQTSSRGRTPKADAGSSASNKAGERAPASGAKGTSTDDKTKTEAGDGAGGTPALPGDEAAKAAEKAKADEAVKAAEKAKADEAAKAAEAAKGSKYAQDLARRDQSWKALNAEKEAFKAEQDKGRAELQRQKAALEGERANWQRQRAEQQAANKPEAYEGWAAKEATKAADLDRQAQAADDRGDFDRAEKLKRAADEARVCERLARDQAEELRRNPPQTDSQYAATQEKARKEWTLKAATDFPEFGKTKSPVQAEAVNFLRYVAQNFPSLSQVPELMYFAAERASLKTAADRAAGLVKELDTTKKALDESNKKVAELEKLTNVSPQGAAQSLGGPKDWDQMSEEEQYAELRREAAGR